MTPRASRSPANRRKSATESAPPDTAMARRSPGLAMRARRIVSSTCCSSDSLIREFQGKLYGSSRIGARRELQAGRRTASGGLRLNRHSLANGLNPLRLLDTRKAAEPVSISSNRPSEKENGEYHALK